MALVGKNGVGKTNTLKGIEYATSIAVAGMIDEHKKFEYIKKFSAKFYFKHNKKSFEYKLRLLGKGPDYIHDSLSLVKNGQKIDVFTKKNKRKLHFTGVKEPVFIPAQMSGMKYIIGSILSDKKSPDHLHEVKMHSHSIIDFILELYKIKYYEVRDEPQLRFLYVDDFESWKEKKSLENEENLFSYQFYDFFKNQKDDFEEYKSIVQSLGLIDDVKFQKYDISETEGDSSNIIIIISFIVDKKTVPFHWLSDGTKRVIRILFYLFYDKASIMLIEEPESSIHWGLLVNLIRILDQYSFKRRILISTHSEQILNNLKPQQLIYLYLDKGNTKLKYVTKRNLIDIDNFLSDVGPLGEYYTSGSFEGIVDD